MLNDIKSTLMLNSKVMVFIVYLYLDEKKKNENSSSFFCIGGKGDFVDIQFISLPCTYIEL